ncbi:unnamed protein product [Caenorhabditis brenneri]
MTEDDLPTICTDYFRNSTLTRQQIYDLIRPEEDFKKADFKKLLPSLILSIGIYQCVYWVIRKRRHAASQNAQRIDDAM